MGLLVTTDIDCDFCPDWAHGVVAHRVQKRRARETAHKAGWITRRGKNGRTVDVCPSCLKKFRQAGCGAEEEV